MVCLLLLFLNCCCAMISGGAYLNVSTYLLTRVVEPTYIDPITANGSRDKNKGVLLGCSGESVVVDFDMPNKYEE